MRRSIDSRAAWAVESISATNSPIEDYGADLGLFYEF